MRVSIIEHSFSVELILVQWRKEVVFGHSGSQMNVSGYRSEVDGNMCSSHVKNHHLAFTLKHATHPAEGRDGENVDGT